MTLATSKQANNGTGTGTRAVAIKPITEGDNIVTINGDQQQSSGFYGALDSIGGVLGNAVGSVVQAYANAEVDKISGNPNSFSNEGDPFDQPGGTLNDTGEQPFHVKYQKELLIGGSVAVAGLVLLVVTR